MICVWRLPTMELLEQAQSTWHRRFATVKEMGVCHELFWPMDKGR